MLKKVYRMILDNKEPLAKIITQENVSIEFVCFSDIINC